MIRWLLAAGRGMGAIVGSLTRPAEVRAMVDDDAGNLDAAAGCEFVDDRIHWLE